MGKSIFVTDGRKYQGNRALSNKKSVCVSTNEEYTYAFSFAQIQGK